MNEELTALEEMLADIDVILREVAALRHDVQRLIKEAQH